MVGNKNVTNFSIEPVVSIVAQRVGRLLNNKAKINRDTLETFGGLARIVGRACPTACLGSKADRTFVNWSSEIQARDARGTLVQIRHASVVDMSQSLVPQNTLRIGVQILYVQVQEGGIGGDRWCMGRAMTRRHGDIGRKRTEVFLRSR
jgi:hypothetical protein